MNTRIPRLAVLFELPRPCVAGVVKGVFSSEPRLRILVALLSVALFVCVAAMTVPRVKWPLDHRFRERDSEQSMRTALLPRRFAGPSKGVRLASLSHASQRWPDHRCQSVRITFRRARHSRLGGRRHCHLWPEHQRAQIPYLFLLPPQYWSSVSAINDSSDGIDVPGFGSTIVNAGSVSGLDNSFKSSNTSFVSMKNGVALGGIDSLLGDSEISSLALSGGSISDSSRMAVDADGALQLSIGPDWSFIAKVDGQFAPEPQIYAGSGTVRYEW